MGERRHRHLVQGFQYKLILRMFIYWFVYTVTMWNFLFCWHLLARGNGDVLAEYSRFAQEFYPMLFCFMILAPIFAWDAVKFYHGIAGPLVQIRRAVTDVAAGRPVRRVDLRQSDELTELQDDFNSMLDTLVQSGAVSIATSPASAGRSSSAAKSGTVSINGESRTEKSTNGTIKR